MPKPMKLADAAARSYSVQDTAAAAGVTRHQIEAWLQRGFLKPEHKPAPPAPRRYSYSDVFNIAAFAEMVRLGLPVAKCPAQVLSLPGVGEKLDLLAFWQGPSELIGAKERGTGQPIGGKPASWYDPANPQMHCKVVQMADMVKLVQDGNVRALVLVNLAHVEDRVLASLADAA